MLPSFKFPKFGVFSKQKLNIYEKYTSSQLVIIMLLLINIQGFSMLYALAHVFSL